VGPGPVVSACHTPALSSCGAPSPTSQKRFVPYCLKPSIPSLALSLTTSLRRSASGHSPPSSSSSPDADVAGGLNNATSHSIQLRPPMILLLLVTLLLSSNIVAYPSAIPLAVRSPYLNCWLHSNSSILGQTWSATYNSSQVCHPHIFSWPQSSQLHCVRC
jgi:hypothetical protein